MSCWRLVMAFSISIGFIAEIAAQPLVIYDSGRTKPLTGESNTFRSSSPKPRMPSDYDLSLLFPVETPSMRPGLSARSIDPQHIKLLQRLPMPLFLIGSDELSTNWLAEYRQRLIDLGAVGFLIDGETSAAYQEILAIAGPELVIVPSSAEQLAKVLGLSHYPVLLTREGVLQ